MASTQTATSLVRPDSSAGDFMFYKQGQMPGGPPGIGLWDPGHPVHHTDVAKKSWTGDLLGIGSALEKVQQTAQATSRQIVDELLTQRLGPLAGSAFHAGLTGALLGGGAGLGAALLADLFRSPEDKKREGFALPLALGGLLGGGLGVLYGLYQGGLNPGIVAGAKQAFLQKQAEITKQAEPISISAAIITLATIILGALELRNLWKQYQDSQAAVDILRQGVKPLEELPKILAPVLEHSKKQLANTRQLLGRIIPYGVAGGVAGRLAVGKQEKDESEEEWKERKNIATAVGAAGGALLGSRFLPTVKWWKPLGLDYDYM